MNAVLAGVAAAALLAVLGVTPTTPRALPIEPSRSRPIRGSAITQVVDRALPQRRRRQRDAQLPDALDRLAAGLRGGHAIGPALRELAGATSAPLGAELRSLATALDHGVPVAAALDRWAAHRDASADVRLVAAALKLGAHAGGEVARAVDQISTTLRERRELQGEVRALATQARTSAAVLAIAPLAFTVLVSTIEPRAVGFLVTTPLGLVCLVLGLGLEALGAVWMNQITRRAA